MWIKISIAQTIILIDINLKYAKRLLQAFGKIQNAWSSIDGTLRYPSEFKIISLLNPYGGKKGVLLGQL